MLTLFTIPKPFRGHIAIIQRNAIQSWTLLHPVPEIILFGDEEGTAEVVKEFRLQHIPEVACNKFGTPLVNFLFDTAQRVASYGILCYLNADIILMSDFMKAVQRVVSQKHRFLIVGQRWDVDISKPWRFEESNWEEGLRVYVKEHGTLQAPVYIDYFVFPQGVWQNLPPFAVGRAVWDNWMVYQARSLRVPVIDATRCLTAIHQNHSYSHHPQGKEGVWKGEEAKTNLKLAGGWRNIYTLKDVTHKMTPKGIKVWLPGLLRVHKRIGQLYCWIRSIPLYQELEKMIGEYIKDWRRQRCRG